MTQPPADPRPCKHRRGARVVVACAGDVLLLADSDPGVPGSSWWVTPGGGIDGDEDPRAAAARELFEETGYRAEPSALVGPVAHRVAVHGYSDRVLVQDEVFYLVEVAERFDVVRDGLTATEQQRMGAARWFALDELAGIDVWPQQVGLLARASGMTCREMGTVEESTVPVGPVGTGPVEAGGSAAAGGVPVAEGPGEL